MSEPMPMQEPELVRVSAAKRSAEPAPVVLDANDQPLSVEGVGLLLDAMLPSLQESERRRLGADLTKSGGHAWTADSLAATIREAYSAAAEREGPERSKALQALADVSRHEQLTWENGIAYLPHGKQHSEAFRYPNPTSVQQRYLGTADVLPYARLESVVDRATPVISAGSCFASEIARHMQTNGFNYVVTQHHDPHDQGFSLSPAAWGIIFNVAAFRQLAQFAFSEADPPKVLWRSVKNNRIVYRDPFRDEVTFDSVEEYERERPIFREACKQAFLKAEAFVLTLGLTEVWRMKADGSVLSRVPWRLSPALVEHHVMSVEENLAELELMRETLQRHNPRMRFIVTVSPVPLQATFRGDAMHCVTASTHSKATLRVVAQTWSERHDDVTYFPAYETVTVCSSNPWQFDQRHVQRETVDKVMHLFERVMVRHPGVAMTAAVEAAAKAERPLTLVVSGPECDPHVAKDLLATLSALRHEGHAFHLVLIGDQAALSSLAERVCEPAKAVAAIEAADLCIWGGGEGDRDLLTRARERGLAVLSGVDRDLETGLRMAFEYEGLRRAVGEMRAEAESEADAATVRRLDLLESGYRRYLADRVTPHEAYVAMRELQIEAKPTRAFALSNAVAQAWPAQPVADRRDALFPELDAAGTQSVMDTLESEGFVMLDRRLPDELVEELASAARRLDVEANTGRDRPHPPAPLDVQRQRDPASGYTVRRDQLVAQPGVQRLMAEPGFLRLAQAWLGCEPIMDLVTMWWSFPHEGQAWSEVAQLYHHDMDRLRWLKLFVYLTDVEEENGPHHFVKGTHRACHPSLARDGRIPDSEVEAHHAEGVHRVIAPKGSVFLADTLGLHKGGQVFTGERLMLQLEWTPALFGAPFEERSWKALNANARLENFRAQHPRVFSTWYGSRKG